MIFLQVHFYQVCSWCTLDNSILLTQLVEYRMHRYPNITMTFYKFCKGWRWMPCRTYHWIRRAVITFLATVMKSNRHQDNCAASRYFCPSWIQMTSAMYRGVFLTCKWQISSIFLLCPQHIWTSRTHAAPSFLLQSKRWAVYRNETCIFRCATELEYEG